RYLGALHGQSILLDAGLGPDRTETFRDAVVRGERADHLITDEIVETLSISGTAGDCRNRLRKWALAGLDAPIAILPKRADVAEQIERIGTELVPAWKETRCR